MSGVLLRWACLVVLLGFGVRVAIAVSLWSDPYVPGTEILLAVLVGVYQDLIALILLSGPLALDFFDGHREARLKIRPGLDEPNAFHIIEIEPRLHAFPVETPELNLATARRELITDEDWIHFS